MATMTSQQLRDYEARMYGKTFSTSPRQCGKTIMVEELTNECKLHNSIIDYCKSKGWQYLHGSMAERTHRTLGEPDFIILAHGSQLRMIEVKSKTGKLSTDQQAFIAHAKKNGHVIFVVRSMDEFVKLFV